MPFGPFLAWKRGDVLGASQRLSVAAGVTALAIVLAYSLSGSGPWLAPLGLGLGIWVIAGALSELAFRVKFVQAPWEEVIRRLRNLPRSAYGTATAHIGVGVMVLGIVATSAWQSETITTMKPGDRIGIAGYDLEFLGVAPGQGPNYREQAGQFSVRRNGVEVTRLTPSKRSYVAPKTATTEAGIHASWSGDLYTVLGDELQDGAFTLRVYFNPLVRLIWIGALIMFFGGLLSLSDRRLRVGAPRRAQISASPVAAE
jgi:cytochrome c-type biogenesis protein CcmF